MTDILLWCTQIYLFSPVRWLINTFHPSTSPSNLRTNWTTGLASPQLSPQQGKTADVTLISHFCVIDDRMNASFRPIGTHPIRLWLPIGQVAAWPSRLWVTEQPRLKESRLICGEGKAPRFHYWDKSIAANPHGGRLQRTNSHCRWAEGQFGALTSRFCFIHGS